MLEAFQFQHVRGGHREPGDDEHEVVQAPVVEGAEDLEKMRLHAGQERVGCLVEQLDRRRGGPECLMAGQHLHGFGCGNEQVGGLVYWRSTNILRLRYSCW